MRNALLAALAATSLLGACKWTDFDDLEDTTWVRSTQDPEIGSSDYPVAIAGVSSGTSGGTLAVVSDDISKYSLIEYSSAGDASVNTAQAISLGGQQIGAVSDTPVFVTDPAGRIALVERSSNGGGNFAVFFGSATAPAGLEFAATTQPAPTPDAAVFVPNGANFDLVFAAGNSIYTLASTGGTPVACMGMDNNNMPLQVAALDHDGTNLWVWTKSGSLISYPLSALTPCNGGTLPAPGATSFTPTGGFMPSAGARAHVVGAFAILSGRPSGASAGSVFVVNLSNLTQVGSTLMIEGLRTTTIATFGSETYLVTGVPARNVDGVPAGEVDLHRFEMVAGALDALPALSLHDSDPESGQLFGRALAMMNFNGSPILVVGAKAEILAYYRTALYEDRR
jgi:hypothetical protein